ncbi:N-acetylmuramoyl-L-alanine amidase [Streptomyces sp. NPDC059534]|uniref:peptidoglycan recognition protein family protein n=1 Tax=Streptomyces sp. NPDC059534 TaxID=3346859 RepID=UPI0036B86504
MARTGPQRIPGAVLDLFFGTGRYSGSDMEVNCGVIHTTEGPTLYDYQGGASAPTVTSVPDFKAKRLVHHQHFDVDESARALVNEPGGVQTNTANVFQWELVGTCDPATHAKWTRQGIEHIYWPDPPDWAIRDVAALMRWLNEQHGIPLTGRSEWLAYPGSYGDSRVRMSNWEWTAFKGWCGHQHVPENDHGDPGALPFARILAAAKGGTTPPKEDPAMALSDSDVDRIALRLLTYRNAIADAESKKAGMRIPDFYGYVVQTLAGVRALTAKVDQILTLLNAQKEK